MPEVWYLKHIREQDREIRKLRKKIGELEQDLEEERRKREEAESEIKRLADAKAAKRPKFPDYSLGRQERLQNGKTAKSSGRRPKAEKLVEVTREEDAYPTGVPPEDCVLDTTRIVTRLTGGQKEVVLYRVYRKKWSTEKGVLTDVLPRSEYGFEVVIAVAFLIHGLGLSYDQTRQVLAFFCHLDLEKSEIECLLQQLSREWRRDFETICDLVLLSLVVYLDETGWKTGKQRNHTWIFTTALHTVLLYGESREEAVLDRILPREEFRGIGVSDCLRIYERRFPRAQKCWAHFLRKAIRLMLLYPEDSRYRRFFDSLFDIFVAAKTAAAEQVGKRREKTATGAEETALAEAFAEQIRALCTENDTKLTKQTPKDFREFVNLQKSLVRNIEDLFTFVFADGVEPTNNRAERGFRKTAQARNNYRTSKTAAGAERKSVIASVLASLQQNLPDFCLQSITGEVVRWRQEGESLFRKQLVSVQQGAFP